MPAKTVPGQWQLAFSTHGGPSQTFSDVVAPAKNDAWAIGETYGKPEKPIFAHWNGKTWASVTVPAAAGLFFGVDHRTSDGHFALSSGPGNVWLFGDNATTAATVALVYNGKTWRHQSLPANFAVPLAVVSPDDVWVQTNTTCTVKANTGCTVLGHWNGKTWSAVTVNGVFPSGATAGGRTWIVTVPDPSPPVREIGPHGNPILYKATGAKISKVTGKEGGLHSYQGYQIAAAPKGQLWISGFANAKNRLYHWTGTKWTQSPVPGLFGILTGPMSYDGHGGIYVGYQAHYTDGKWVNIARSHGKPAGGLSCDIDSTTVIPGTSSLIDGACIVRSKTNGAVNAAVAVYQP